MYATQTSVSVERSKAEIETVLTKYGASEFVYGMNQSGAMVGFKIGRMVVKIMLPLPPKNDPKFQPKRMRFGTNRAEKVHQNWEQACRARWRALLLVIRAKLEACELKISTLEREFLTDILLPNGQTVGEWTHPQLMSQTGEMPKLLPGS